MLVSHKRIDHLPLQPGEEKYIETVMFSDLGKFLSEIIPVTLELKEDPILQERTIRLHVLSVDEWRSLVMAAKKLPWSPLQQEILDILFGSENKHSLK